MRQVTKRGEERAGPAIEPMLLDRVLHDLKQPLNLIRVLAQDVRLDVARDRFDVDGLPESMATIEKTVDELVHRIDELRAQTSDDSAPSGGGSPSPKQGNGANGAAPPDEPAAEKLLLVGELTGKDEHVLAAAERDGFTLVRAANCDEARKAVRSTRPLLAIIDHRLPDGDGVELLKELRQLQPGCEAILVTPGGEIEDAIEVLRAGALDYLRQPIDANRLHIAFGRARERSRHRLTPEAPAILVLEDHEPTLKRLTRVLRKEGYQVAGASDGEEGMRLFREKRFDLILADVKMPAKDGIEVLRETKGAGLDVEVIMITGYGDEEIVVQALRDGAINFLRKPIDIEHMLLAIQKALDYQTARRSLAYRSRDMELMQELVVRLTHRLELIVEAPQSISDQAREFLHQLVDSLPLGIVVAGPEREVLYANQHVVSKIGKAPESLATDWLKTMGLFTITEEDLRTSFGRMMSAKPGTIETLMLSKWSFLVMTPLKLLRPNGSVQFVALAIRGERRPQPA